MIGIEVGEIAGAGVVRIACGLLVGLKVGVAGSGMAVMRGKEIGL